LSVRYLKKISVFDDKVCGVASVVRNGTGGAQSNGSHVKPVEKCTTCDVQT